MSKKQNEITTIPRGASASAPLIAALSTPPGRGAIAIVRLSGDGAPAAAASLFGRDPASLTPRKMYCGVLNARDGVRDSAVLVVFDERSYTGEPAAEIHCHGSPVVTEAVLAALIEKGARLAERGEFTRRAYMNGKLDLTRAEGIVDLIDSRSPAAARAAFNQADGKLYREIAAVAEQVTDAAAAIGAAIDYPEEGLDEELNVDLSGPIARLEALADSYAAGSAALSGVEVVLIGKPNAGKSTLFNALLGYDRSIVTDQPGTTRDTVSDGYLYKGVRFNLTDTAGLRDALDEPERQGVLRSRQAAGKADVLLEIDENGAFGEPGAVRVLSKADANPAPAGDITVSAKTGAGLEALKELIYERAGTLEPGEAALTNLRQYEAVRAALDSLRSAEQALVTATPDCAAVELRAALQALGSVTGARATESVVNRIFERFCVGK